MDERRLCVGILAHVDSGKTTLAEAMLYHAGSIRRLGRVDNRDAFLDTFALEKARGITIFSKQAVFHYQDAVITLLDTPGHVDFSAETERALWVLDCAILVISGADGVQGHTQTLWRLLQKHHIPVFLFVNKMDQPGCDKDSLMRDIHRHLSEACIDFSADPGQEMENIALCREDAMDEYLSGGTVCDATIKSMIAARMLFPCYFGSALRLEGIDSFLDGIIRFTNVSEYPTTFGAKIYKISRDAGGNRLTHMKITGGSLQVKSSPLGDDSPEKINQIRIYSGARYETVTDAPAGEICCVTGLVSTKPGQGLGVESDAPLPSLLPVLNYDLNLPDDCLPAAFMPRLLQLEEEIPELHPVWNARLSRIQVQLMGEVQTEILKSLIAERFGISVRFGKGEILYRETIANTVEGVGHYEPLRHYAEVHLILHPLPKGSGLQFDSICSTDCLARNWQRLILTHLAEKEHLGVLTGSPITDMRITLASGKDHLKHTEGGDFRKATYRAVRQGLMQAQSILLEPYYGFCLEIPSAMTGRAISDIQAMDGTFTLTSENEDQVVITGSAPVAAMQHYAMDVIAYTHGRGKLSCWFLEYAPCRNADAVIARIGYNPESDVENTPNSVFCSHGAGYPVRWNEVSQHMHLESSLADKQE